MYKCVFFSEIIVFYINIFFLQKIVVSIRGKQFFFIQKKKKTLLFCTAIKKRRGKKNETPDTKCYWKRFFLLASFWLAEPEDRKKKGKININRLTEKLLFLVARTRRDLRLKNTQKKKKHDKKQQQQWTSKATQTHNNNHWKAFSVVSRFLCLICLNLL